MNILYETQNLIITDDFVRNNTMPAHTSTVAYVLKLFSLDNSKQFTLTAKNFNDLKNKLIGANLISGFPIEIGDRSSTQIIGQVCGALAREFDFALLKKDFLGKYVPYVTNIQDIDKVEKRVFVSIDSALYLRELQTVGDINELFKSAFPDEQVLCKGEYEKSKGFVEIFNRKKHKHTVYEWDSNITLYQNMENISNKLERYKPQNDNHIIQIKFIY